MFNHEKSYVIETCFYEVSAAHHLHADSQLTYDE